MRKISMTIAWAAAVALAAPVAAAATAPDGDKKEEVVCKKLQGTGWRIRNGATICKTRAEWSAQGEEFQKGYSDFNRGRGDFNDYFNGQRPGN